jgi:hypothetical protein
VTVVSVLRVSMSQGGVLDLLHGGLIEAGVLPPQPIAVAQVLELLGDDRLEGRADHGALCMVFRQTADEQINVIDAAEHLLEVGEHGWIAGDLTESATATGLPR